MKCIVFLLMCLAISVSYAQEVEVKVTYNKGNDTLSISIHNPTGHVVNVRNGEDSAMGYDFHCNIEDANGSTLFGYYRALENSSRKTITIQPKETYRQELNVTKDFQIEKKLKGHKIVFMFNLFYKSDKPRRFQKKFTFSLID